MATLPDARLREPPSKSAVGRVQGHGGGSLSLARRGDLDKGGLGLDDPGRLRGGHDRRQQRRPVGEAGVGFTGRAEWLRLESSFGEVQHAGEQSGDVSLAGGAGRQVVQPVELLEAVVVRHA